jgi:hypothetical protein
MAEDRRPDGMKRVWREGFPKSKSQFDVELTFELSEGL